MTRQQGWVILILLVAILILLGIMSSQLNDIINNQIVPPGS